MDRWYEIAFAVWLKSIKWINFLAIFRRTHFGFDSIDTHFLEEISFWFRNWHLCTANHEPIGNSQWVNERQRRFDMNKNQDNISMVLGWQIHSSMVTFIRTKSHTNRKYFVFWIETIFISNFNNLICCWFLRRSEKAHSQTATIDGICSVSIQLHTRIPSELIDSPNQNQH